MGAIDLIAGLVGGVGEAWGNPLWFGRGFEARRLDGGRVRELVLLGGFVGNRDVQFALACEASEYGDHDGFGVDIEVAARGGTVLL